MVNYDAKDNRIREKLGRYTEIEGNEISYRFFYLEYQKFIR